MKTHLWGEEGEEGENLHDFLIHVLAFLGAELLQDGKNNRLQGGEQVGKAADTL